MIVTKLAGGLGNQMFQYAAGRSLSLKYNTDLFLDLTFLNDRTPRKNFVYRSFNLDIFDISFKFAGENEIVNFGRFERFARYYYPVKRLFSANRLRYVREDPYRFDESFFRIADNTYLEGYWQSDKYFADTQEVIRNDFSFRNDILLDNTAILNSMQAGTAVCLNVRRGDFVSNPNASEHHGSCSMDYFNEAIRYYDKQLGSDARFFVFSDDIAWCRENFTGNKFYVVDHTNAGKAFANYLFLMTQCDHFIIPNSSFGWWAAWLGKNTEKMVVAPAKWYNNPKMDTSSLIPSGWVRM